MFKHIYNRLMQNKWQTENLKLHIHTYGTTSTIIGIDLVHTHIYNIDIYILYSNQLKQRANKTNVYIYNIYILFTICIKEKSLSSIRFGFGFSFGFCLSWKFTTFCNDKGNTVCVFVAIALSFKSLSIVLSSQQ